MSVGVSNALSPTRETLEFIDNNWRTVALTFDRAVTVDGQYDTFQYDVSQYSSREVWVEPVLRNGDDGTIYRTNSHHGYDSALRNNDIVTVRNGGRTDEALGQEHDFDVAWDVQVEIEALNNGFSVIGGSTDFKVFVHIVRRAIVSERYNPLPTADNGYNWRWLTIENEETIPETEGNRDHYGKVVTVRWYGWEELPG